jgi:hypothetical protein
MVEESEGMTGGCQCGAVRYRLNATPKGTHICHCRMCQKASGSPVMAWTGVASDRFSVTRGMLASFASSEIAERGFCAACGTPLTYRSKRFDNISVTMGSLDRPADLFPKRQLGVESRLPWFAGLAGLPERTTEGWFQAFGIQSAEGHQHPDHET